ncbi:hypothetical protein [Alteromonas gracilis]|uniref:hypothetical protein n=1 Tax=Alteromonas gracilis TaxID=1479524 RepID=UPI002FDFF969
MKRFGNSTHRIIQTISIILCVSFFSSTIQADTYIVGAQNIEYSPYYNFSSPHEKGLGWAILEAFSKHSGHQFIYLSMPVKRLQIELKKGNVDFVFPDNPRWNDHITHSVDKAYSLPLVDTFAVTLVKPENKGKGISFVSNLIIPDGFTPAKWKKQVNENTVYVIGVNSVYEGLSLLNKEKANAMDIEYNVAQRIIRRYPNIGEFTADLTLPFNTVSFSVSTLKHPDIIHELNTFLNSNSKTINEIKNKYGIEETKQLTQRLMKQQGLTKNVLWSAL